MYTGDLMHGSDLGPKLDLHGSTMRALTSAHGAIRGATSKEARVLILWEEQIIAYEAPERITKRLQNLTSSMMGDSTGACLACKASESRHLVLAMLRLLHKLND